MLGRRKAASNASICIPAPNAAAFRLSRTRPVMRDSSVMPLTVDSARNRFNTSPGWRAVARRAVSCYYAWSFLASPDQEELRPMANSAQARKRARQAAQTNKHNASLRSSLRTAVKAVRKAVAGGDKAAAMKTLTASQAVIDRIADKKIVHKNMASRTKSRLAHAIKAMA
jgi:small subunit ribosomal protein S20